MIHPINMPADFMRAPPTVVNSEPNGENLIGERTEMAKSIDSNDRANMELFSQMSEERHKPVITYTESGRRLLDGKVESEKRPSALWNQVFLQSMVGRMFSNNNNNNNNKTNNNEAEQNPTANEQIFGQNGQNNPINTANNEQLIDDVMAKATVTSSNGDDDVTISPVTSSWGVATETTDRNEPRVYVDFERVTRIELK